MTRPAKQATVYAIVEINGVERERIEIKDTKFIAVQRALRFCKTYANTHRDLLRGSGGEYHVYILIPSEK